MEENQSENIPSPTPPVVDTETPPISPPPQPPFGSWWKVGVLVVGVLLAGSIVYAGYQYSQRQISPPVVPISSPTPISTSISPTPTIRQADSEKTTIVPYPLVDTSAWQKQIFPELKLSFSTPPGWKILSKTAWAVSFDMSETGSLTVMLGTPKEGQGRRDFIWKQILGMTSDLAEAIKTGLVDSPKEWLIDGIPSLSLLYRRNPSYPREFSDNLVIPVGSQMIFLGVWRREFSAKDPELFTMLSTIKISK